MSIPRNVCSTCALVCRVDGLSLESYPKGSLSIDTLNNVFGVDWVTDGRMDIAEAVCGFSSDAVLYTVKTISDSPEDDRTYFASHSTHPTGPMPSGSSPRYSVLCTIRPIFAPRESEPTLTTKMFPRPSE